MDEYEELSCTQESTTHIHKHKDFPLGFVIGFLAGSLFSIGILLAIVVQSL
ncbi:MAG: hypothetical protein PVJ39_04700 [Gammaproteobacteria bacterium]|jgi:hypothetical protein